MTQTDTLWSVLKYDLKTALEVVGLPCCLKLADDTLGNVSPELLERSGIGTGSVIKIEKELRFACVRVRICAPVDPDWFVFTKGEEFVRDHGRYVGTELLIPLGFRGKFRLCDRKGGQEYNNIREVVRDFPRFIKVEQDTVCASSSSRAFHVVHAGTELQLDRVTEGNRLVRGARDRYLVCLDRNSDRELTFQVFTPGTFTKMTDNTKYTLADIVERLPLPQKAESVSINPHDVVSADDDDAQELLLMLSGPIEIHDVTMVTMYVGLVQNKYSNECDIIAIPADCDLESSTNVYIPMSYIVDGAENPYCSYKLGHLNTEVIREELYLRPVGCGKLLLLKNLKSRDVSYGEEEPPDTPRLPRRHDDFMTLKSTVSAPTGTEACDTEMTDGLRRRFLSTGDIKVRKSASLNSPEREFRGIRAYLSQLTRRMKSSASQLLFGIDPFPPRTPGSRRERERERGRMRAIKQAPVPVSKSGGFVCYINKDHEESMGLESKAETNNHESVEERIECDTPQKNGPATIRKVKRDVEEVIYAYIDRTSHTISATKFDNQFPCSVCQQILEMQAHQDSRDG